MKKQKGFIEIEMLVMIIVCLGAVVAIGSAVYFSGKQEETFTRCLSKGGMYAKPFGNQTSYVCVKNAEIINVEE